MNADLIHVAILYISGGILVSLWSDWLDMQNVDEMHSAYDVHELLPCLCN